MRRKWTAHQTHSPIQFLEMPSESVLHGLRKALRTKRTLGPPDSLIKRQNMSGHKPSPLLLASSGQHVRQCKKENGCVASSGYKTTHFLGGVGRSKLKTTQLAMLQWPKRDKIKWIENRLGEQKDKRLRLESVPPAQDLQIWLEHVRDGRTWAQLARKLYRKLKCEAGRSKARRAYQRVEQYVTANPNDSEQARYEELDQRRMRRKVIGLAPDYLEKMEMDHLRQRIRAKRRRPFSVTRYRRGKQRKAT